MQSDHRHQPKLEQRLAVATQRLALPLQRIVVDHVRGGSPFETLRDIPKVWNPLSRASADIGLILDSCQERGLEILSLSDPTYPALLKQCAMPPPVLYLRRVARDPLRWYRALAIVGSRKASIESCSVASDIAMHVASAGVCIVSGLALGVDGAAHRGALQASPSVELLVPTIAVLAHGLDQVYPGSHRKLADSIVENGGILLSEFPPGTDPLKHHFLQRNRVIAGLCEATLVVQAGARSGSLVTAQFAVDEGRDVYVYGENDEEHSATLFVGGEHLIDEGAMSITRPEEILSGYGLTPTQIQTDPPNPSRLVRVPLDHFLAVTRLTLIDIVNLERTGDLCRQPGNALNVREELWNKLRAT